MRPDVLGVTIADAGEDCLVTCDGPLDQETAANFREAVDAVVDLHPERIYLDCAGVSSIDATGVGAVMHLAFSCRSKGIVLTATMNDSLLRIFDPVGVGSIITFHS
jgi:anti-anti-sigma factor